MMFVLMMLGVIIPIVVFAIGLFTYVKPDEKGSERRFVTLVISVIALGVLLLVGGMCVNIVDAGHVGVLKTFGKVDPNVASPGLVITAPWTEVINFNVQQHESFQAMEGGSRDNVMYTANVAFIYKIDPTYASWMYNEIGTDYENVAITSNVRDACREVLGQYDAMYAYSEGRQDVSKALLVKLVPVFNERHLILLNVNFRDYTIPEQIKNAAATKKATEQQIETARAKIDIKKMEAQALIEEGKGIAEYQRIVTSGITPSLIEWRGQEKLAEAASHGNMIIVVTDGKSTLPFIAPVQKVNGS